MNDDKMGQLIGGALVGLAIFVVGYFALGFFFTYVWPGG
jgi:hypothetical protein